MDVGRSVEAGNHSCLHWQSVGEGKAGWLSVLINNALCVFSVHMPKNQVFVEGMQPVTDKRFRARKGDLKGKFEGR